MMGDKMPASKPVPEATFVPPIPQGGIAGKIDELEARIANLELLTDTINNLSKAVFGGAHIP